MLHVAAKSSSAIRGNAWHRNPEAKTSAACGFSSAVQPSGLRGQASPRPRFKIVAMAAPVRGRGDARPPSRAGSKALPGTAAAERTTGAWHLLESRHASHRSEIVIRDSRQCLAPQPGGHDISRGQTHPGRAAFGVAAPGIASSAFQGRRDGGALALAGSTPRGLVGKPGIGTLPDGGFCDCASLRAE
jgi:hypothetical protein